MDTNRVPKPINGRQAANTPPTPRPIVGNACSLSRPASRGGSAPPGARFARRRPDGIGQAGWMTPSRTSARSASKPTLQPHPRPRIRATALQQAGSIIRCRGKAVRWPIKITNAIASRHDVRRGEEYTKKIHHGFFRAQAAIDSLSRRCRPPWGWVDQPPGFKALLWACWSQKSAPPHGLSQSGPQSRKGEHCAKFFLCVERFLVAPSVAATSRLAALRSPYACTKKERS